MSEKAKQRLSYLQSPEWNEVPEDIQEIVTTSMESQQENWGFINNLFNVLPLNPLQFKGFLDFKASLFTPETGYLNNIDKEMIGLVVSSANHCSYCITTHSDTLRGLSKDPIWVDKLIYNYRSAELTEKQLALCDYAHFVTAYPTEITEAQVDNLRRSGFNDHEILEAAYVAGFFNYTNRWVSTIGAVANDGHFSHNR